MKYLRKTKAGVGVRVRQHAVTNYHVRSAVGGTKSTRENKNERTNNSKFRESQRKRTQ